MNIGLGIEEIERILSEELQNGYRRPEFQEDRCEFLDISTSEKSETGLKLEEIQQFKFEDAQEIETTSSAMTYELPKQTPEDSSIELKWEEIKQFLFEETEPLAEQPTSKDDKYSKKGYAKLQPTLSKHFPNETWNKKKSINSRIEKQKTNLRNHPKMNQTFSNTANGYYMSALQMKTKMGDTSDIWPNPMKLYQMEVQMRKIRKKREELSPVSHLSQEDTHKFRREKRLLKGKMCRLKQNVHHESNKIIFYGLATEQHRLLSVMRMVRQKINERTMQTSKSLPMSKVIEDLYTQYLGKTITGHTADFVSSVIRQVEAGDPTGGINLQT